MHHLDTGCIVYCVCDLGEAASCVTASPKSRRSTCPDSRPSRVTLFKFMEYLDARKRVSSYLRHFYEGAYFRSTVTWTVPLDCPIFLFSQL